jgi:hypothetical protein
MILKRKELSKKDELYIEGEGNDENEMSRKIVSEEQRNGVSSGRRKHE